MKCCLQGWLIKASNDEVKIRKERVAETRSLSCDRRPHLVSHHMFSPPQIACSTSCSYKAAFQSRKDRNAPESGRVVLCRGSLAEMRPSFKEINVDAMTPLTASLNRGSTMPLTLT